MNSLEEDIKTIAEEVIEHIQGIIGITKTATAQLEDAAISLDNLIKSSDPDDASDAIAFLGAAELLLSSIGTKFSPKVETLSDTIDSVLYQINLNKESK